MPAHLIPLLCCALLSALPGIAVAQDAALDAALDGARAAAQEAARTMAQNAVRDFGGRGYEVEIIAFKHISPNTGGELFFPPAEKTLDEFAALRLWGDPQLAGQELDESVDNARGYVALGDGKRMLNQLGLLAASPYYQPVAHFAWRQPALANPKLVRLGVPPILCAQATGTPAALDDSMQLDGVMRVRNLGELVFEFDLNFSDCASAYLEGQKVEFRVHGNPQVLFNKVYYFDHPLLGVLLEVRRDDGQ